MYVHYIKIEYFLSVLLGGRNLLNFLKAINEETKKIIFSLTSSKTVFFHFFGPKQILFLELFSLKWKERVC